MSFLQINLFVSSIAFLPYQHEELSYIGLLNLSGAKFTCHILNFVSSDFGVGVCIVSENMLIVFLKYVYAIN